MEIGILLKVSHFPKSKTFQLQSAYSWKLAYFFERKPICIEVTMELIRCLDNKSGLLILSMRKKMTPPTSFNNLNSFLLKCQRIDSSCPLLLHTYLELKDHLFTKKAIIYLLAMSESHFPQLQIDPLFKITPFWIKTALSLKMDLSQDQSFFQEWVSSSKNQ